MALDRSKRPETHGISCIEIIKPEQVTFDNGIPVNVIRMGDTPVSRLDLIFERGRCDEGKPMVSDFTASLMREGTATRTAEEIAGILDFYGSWMGSESSAHNTTLSIYSLNRHFKDIIDVFAEIATKPIFPEKELDNMKALAASRLKNNCQKVSYLASAEFQKRYYGDTHNLGKRPDEETIFSITRDELMNFHRENICLENAKIVISGIVDDNMLSILNNSFGQTSITKHASKSQSDKPHKKFSPGTFTVEKSDAVQSAIKIGIPTILRTHPDYIPLRILVTALGGYFGSRLMQNIREEKGYTYGISALLIGMRDNSCITISSQCATAYTKKVIEEICNEMRKLQNAPIEKDELERVKSYMRGDLAKTTDTPFSLADYYCASITNNIPENYFRCQCETIDSITPDKLQDTAKKYLDCEQMLTVVAGLLK